MIPQEDSDDILDIYYFKSANSYLNTDDLLKHAAWFQSGSEYVDFKREFPVVGGLIRLVFNIYKKESSEKFFIYFKIVDKAGNAKYFRTDGIVLYGGSDAINKVVTYFKNAPESQDVGVTSNKNKIVKLIDISTNTEYSDLYFATELGTQKFIVDLSVFCWRNNGTYDFKVPYIPGCCEKSDIADERDLPSFGFKAVVAS